MQHHVTPYARHCICHRLISAHNLHHHYHHHSSYRHHHHVRDHHIDIFIVNEIYQGSRSFNHHLYEPYLGLLRLYHFWNKTHLTPYSQKSRTRTCQWHSLNSHPKFLKWLSTAAWLIKFLLNSYSISSNILVTDTYKGGVTKSQHITKNINISHCKGYLKHVIE